MRFYTRKRKAPSIIIVSLIDILAILLIFFIVTTTFQKSQPQLNIKLPESKSAENAAAAKNEPIVLSLEKDQQIKLDGKPVQLDQLTTAIKMAHAESPDRPIALKADETTPYGTLIKVLDNLKEAGIANASAFTDPLKPKPGAKP